jgi:hypothetical protein
MLSDLSFDNYLEAGGWRGYAQKDAYLPSRDAPQSVRTLSAPKALEFPSYPSGESRGDSPEHLNTLGAIEAPAQRRHPNLFALRQVGVRAETGEPDEARASRPVVSSEP